MVTNLETQSCDQPINVNTPCGTFRDCSFRDDGKYPDLESQCHWFHTCSFGQFQGHSPCPASESNQRGSLYKDYMLLRN
ncbi:hypothetical protein CHS0354_032802 [Potamilus streckersoni]|uniref:Chitin-binding type-2 domain-containing protein n=1 Tax=Potamilus streckersoni TaxID=2493646 RepID=A0AAE0S919_9BIVA|nr:hypothetical protein CHS0354_032802 [Potamilus streckersoni]